MDAFLDAWAIHTRKQQHLLEQIAPEGLAGVPQGMKGRSVGEIFAHIHNIRLAWLEQYPTLAAGLVRIPLKSKADKAALNHDRLQTALTASGAAIAALLRQGLESGRISGFKPTAAAFYSYLIAHEWYHHGEICMTLTQAGVPLDDSTLYGLWEWGQP